MTKYQNTRNERIAELIREDGGNITLKFQDDGTETTIKEATLSRWYKEISSDVVELEIGTQEIEVNTVTGTVKVDGIIVDPVEDTLMEKINKASEGLLETAEVQEDSVTPMQAIQENGEISISQERYFLNALLSEAKYQHEFTINNSVIVTTIWRSNGKIERSFYKDLSGQHIAGTKRKGFSTASKIIGTYLNVDKKELTKIMKSLRKEAQGE